MSNVQVQLYVSASSDSIHWRLLTGNNRSAGRGGAEFVSEQECRVAVLSLQRDSVRLRHRMLRLEGNRWGWELHRGEQRVAVAGHLFDRLGRCEQALTKFLLHFADAPLSRLVLDSGCRRWTSPAAQSGRDVLLRARSEPVPGIESTYTPTLATSLIDFVPRRSLVVHASYVGRTPETGLVMPAWPVSEGTASSTEPTPEWDLR